MPGVETARRFVISAPRSGLNWLRYWIEDRYGLATGEQAACAAVSGQPMCLVRSHDPLGLRPARFWRRGQRSGAWARIDPAETEGARVLLLLRHPLEVFVRGAGQSLRRFRSYDSCLQFYSGAQGATRMCLRYEDLISRPETMAAALEFLQLVPRAGLMAPSAQDIADQWQEAGRLSRENYAQRHSSGSRTARNPFDFSFHRRQLSPQRAAMVWAHLDAVLDDEARGLLAPWRMQD